MLKIIAIAVAVPLAALLVYAATLHFRFRASAGAAGYCLNGRAI